MTIREGQQRTDSSPPLFYIPLCKSYSAGIGLLLKGSKIVAKIDRTALIYQRYDRLVSVQIIGSRGGGQKDSKMEIYIQKVG